MKLNFMMMFLIVIIMNGFLLVGCSSNKQSNYEKSEKPSKVLVDHSPKKPDWVMDSITSKEEGEHFIMFSKETVRGDQRLNGCYELASFEAKNKMVREIGEEIKGAIDQAIPDISESTDAILSRVSSGKWEGKVYGMSVEEEYFERYRLFDYNEADSYKERIDCYVKMKISKKDLNRMKVSLVDELKKVDPRIQEAITKKQIDFFHKE